MEMDLKRVCVRPVRPGEEFRYRELMQAHHYWVIWQRSSTLMSHTEQEWVALLTFSASC
ncbi:MAG: hypothetical protein IPK39_11165 [Sulfuritalea sp.]|nr:hypothetical protein [Sulfuritalea sp.]